MFSKFKIILIIIVLICLIVFNVNCYLFKQGLYIIKYNSRAVSIDEMIDDNNLDKKNKDFFNLVNDIRKYAIDSIGLKNNKNYTRFVKTDKDYLVDVVSACDATSFNRYKWCFPFFGCVPYKGYFERKDAEKEAKKLKNGGMDVIIDEVDAFSTLGIFPDPIFSFMSSYSVFELASLIIHEQTHATIFIKNQIAFNEQTATFIGNQGALNFISNRYGKESKEYKSIISDQTDLAKYLDLLKKLYASLDSMYCSNEYTKDMKLELKEQIIDKFKDSIRNNYDSLFKTQNYKRLENMKINNAFLTARMTYVQNLDLFNKLYAKKENNLRETVNYLKQFKKIKNKDPEIIIKSYVE